LVDVITAHAVLNGFDYSGSNVVEVLRDEAITRNVHVVVSETAFQGTLSAPFAIKPASLWWPRVSSQAPPIRAAVRFSPTLALS